MLVHELEALQRQSASDYNVPGEAHFKQLTKAFHSLPKSVKRRMHILQEQWHNDDSSLRVIGGMKYVVNWDAVVLTSTRQWFGGEKLTNLDLKGMVVFFHQLENYILAVRETCSIK